MEVLQNSQGVPGIDGTVDRNNLSQFWGNRTVHDIGSLDGNIEEFFIKPKMVRADLPG